MEMLLPRRRVSDSLLWQGAMGTWAGYSALALTLNGCVAPAASPLETNESANAVVVASSTRGCRKPLLPRRPVVVVGGYGYTKSNRDEHQVEPGVGLAKIVAELAADVPTDWPHGPIHFAESVTPIAGNAQRASELAAEIRPLCAQYGPVDILANSMGGLTARYAIEELGENDASLRACIASLTTMGTPHRGTPVSRFASDPAAAQGLSPRGTEETLNAPLRAKPSRKGAVHYRIWAALSRFGQRENPGAAAACDHKLYDPRRRALHDRWPDDPGAFDSLQNWRDLVKSMEVKGARFSALLNFGRWLEDPGSWVTFRDCAKDGWVCVESARLRSAELQQIAVDFLGCVPAHHFELTTGYNGQGLPDEDNQFDYIDFWRDNVEQLANLP